MQEKYWQQLKSQICPKDRWVPDSQATKCSCCGKEFKFLIRRKHHCRFCGKIFCSDCSNFFLNGNYIGIPDQKFVRNCEFCHHRIQKFIRDCSKYPQLSKSPEKQWSEKSNDEEHEDSLKQNNIFADSQPISSLEASMKVEEQIKQFLLAASQYLCLKFEIDNKFWGQRLADISLRAALETKMDVMIQNQDQNTMDIAKKVRIRAITTPQHEVSCVVFKGITIQKNLYLKNMPRHLNKPKIIVVANSIDADSLASFIKFEQIVKNQKQIMRKLLDKVFKKIQPDVVFVENSICITALQYFKQKKIIAVSKIKPKDIQAIMCVARIKKTIKELWLIERYNVHNIIGTCDKIYFKNVRQQQSLMFMQGDIGIRTIIIGQSTEERSLILKKCLKNLIRFARQMQLEKYIIDTDLEMQSLLIKKQPKCQFPFIQSFTPFMQRSIQSCLSKQQSAFTHITYSLIKLTNAPKNYIQYAQHQSKSSMREVCGRIQYEKKKLYTNSDITLGSFILLTAANSEKNCKKCEYTHCQSFYMHGHEIRIQIERRQSMKVPSIMDDLPDNEAVTFQKLRFFLLKQKQLVVITTYLQCSFCKINLINQSIRVGRNYLQNSLYNFFENISQFYIAEQIRVSELRQTKKKKIRKLSMDCQHQQLTRCFEYNNTLVKFVIEKTIQYDLNHIDIQSNQSKSEIIQYDDNFIRNLYFMQLMQKKQIFEKILVIFNTLPFPCNNSNVSISTKAMFCYPQFIKAKEILEQSKSQLKTIQSRSLKYLESSGHDWTIFMRQIYKIEQLYRTAIDLLNEFELILKKQRIQEIKQLEPLQSLKNKSFSLNYSASQATNIGQNNFAQTLESKQKLNQTNRGNNQQFYRKDSEDTTITTFYKNLGKRRYPRNQGSCLYFTPIYTQDAVSIIAAGLNSIELKKNLNAETPIPNQLKLRIPFNRKLKTSWELKKQLDTIYQQIFPQASQKQTKYDAYDLTIFYHKQFEQLRQRQGISFDLYIRSLCGCRNWDSSGGKSNSKFAKSHNELLVVKIINAKQFVEFQRFCPSYLEYIRQSKDRKQQSYIARIYGIYEVTIKNKNYKCIVMQNIFFGMGSQAKVYDLKGSEVNRLNMPPNFAEMKNITGQDTNFKIDRDGQPIILEPYQYDRTIKILQSDAKFLKDMAVIDYSLLLIISGKSIRIGIIDFMRPYQFIEKVETFYKQLRSGRQPTVIPPQNYAERFITAMRKYFIKVQSLKFV